MAYFIFKVVIINFVLMVANNIFAVSYTIQAITAPLPGTLKSLEGPQWSVQENALYWVSNFGKKAIFRMDGKTGMITARDICYGSPSLIVPVRDQPGFVVVSVRSSLYLLKWGAPGGDSALRQLTTVDRGIPDNNINDGKADAEGRLWFGTLGKTDFSLPTLVPLDTATLYSMDDTNFPNPAIKLRPVSLSNGIAFSLDNSKMYYIDSPTRRIAAFDYDLKTGAISNETVVFSFDDFNVSGVPDGMTIDVNGNLWVATFDRTILVVDPRSKSLLEQIEMPVDRVTSMTWGGEKLDVLFVTTANLNVPNPMPFSGSLLAITGLNTFGVPENQFVFPDAANY